ncbi:hypothetical protein BJ165DRAFT_1531831 [Panaeolus papilionaceus]|nr:hypothetical protein BJ165DRAFT_1531831 [Panaeolus papilionaceus]
MSAMYMSDTGKEYRYLKFSGRTGVVAVTPEDVEDEDVFVYLLMGPTGSGKSAFIQSLSSDHNLDISKDSLESVTQEVICYRVVNLTRFGDAVILVDTPGFLDTKLSESRITAKIMDTLHRICQSAITVSATIYYFQPITDIRLGRTKRDAVRLLRAFAESFKIHVVVITTMWNHISSAKRIDDAHHRLSSLKNEIFVRSDGLRIDIVKFEFSLDSALSILDKTMDGWYREINKSQRTNPQYQSLILNNLVDRITNTQLHLQILAEDKQNATTPGRKDHRLLKVILKDEKAASECPVSEDPFTTLREISPSSPIQKGLWKKQIVVSQ